MYNWEDYKGQKTKEAGWYWIFVNITPEPVWIEEGQQAEWFPIAWIPEPIDFPDVPARYVEMFNKKREG